MAPLALALNLALASAGPPSLAPTDPGPFRVGELALASTGVLLGDVAVLGAGYATLQLFAAGALSPTAPNFRSAAFSMLGAALLLPPLGAVLLARLAGPGVGSVWKALLLASVGQAAALAAGYAAAPHLWVVLPVQLVAVVAGTTLGLHWGGSRRAAAAAPLPAEDAPAPPAVKGEPADPGEAPASAGLVLVPVCPVT